MCSLRLFVPISRLRFHLDMPTFVYDTDMNIAPKIVHSRGRDACLHLHTFSDFVLDVLSCVGKDSSIIWSGSVINLPLHYFNASRLNFVVVYWKLRRTTGVFDKNNSQVTAKVVNGNVCRDKTPKSGAQTGEQGLSDVTAVKYGGVI